MISKLNVYNKSYRKAIEIHRISMDFPKIEQYGGIADQLRRSSKSITANIVEGFGKQSFYKNEFKKMLVYSIGSCDETILWIKTAKDLNYLNQETSNYYLNEYQILVKKISSFVRNIRN